MDSDSDVEIICDIEAIPSCSSASESDEPNEPNIADTCVMSSFRYWQRKPNNFVKKFTDSDWFNMYWLGVPLALISILQAVSVTIEARLLCGKQHAQCNITPASD